MLTEHRPEGRADFQCMLLLSSLNLKDALLSDVEQPSMIVCLVVRVLYVLYCVPALVCAAPDDLSLGCLNHDQGPIAGAA